MKNLGTLQLKTNRLLLRKFKLSDAKMMFKNWANDEENVKYMTWPKHDNLDVTKMIISSWLTSYEKDNFYQWAITLKNNPDEVIGSITLSDFEPNSLEIGYCLSKKYWNQGIATEASKRLIKFAFEELLVDQIVIQMSVENPASEKVAIKLGATNMGKVDIYFPLKDKTVTCYSYVINKKSK